MSDTDQRVLTAAENHVQKVREKILFALEIYPRMSMTHLQVSLGTGLPPELWHPVFDQLCEENLIEKVQVRPSRPPPSGRDQVYTIVQLKKQ